MYSTVCLIPKNTRTNLNAKLPLASVKYSFSQWRNKTKGEKINGALKERKENPAIYSERFTYSETLTMNCY